MGINLKAHTVYSVKRLAEPSAATKNLPVFRLITAMPGVNVAENTLDLKLVSKLLNQYWPEQLTKPEEDRDPLVELSFEATFTVPKDLEGFVSSLRPGMLANDLWDQLAKWKKSSFHTPPVIPAGLITDPLYEEQWNKVWEERRKAIGCRLHSVGSNPAVKTKFTDTSTQTLIEYREYCDDNVLSRDPNKGPAYIILKDGIYSDWCFLQRKPDNIFAKADATLPALEQIEMGIIGQRQKAIEVNNLIAANEYVDAALAKVRAQMAKMREGK